MFRRRRNTYVGNQSADIWLDILQLKKVLKAFHIVNVIM